MDILARVRSCVPPKEHAVAGQYDSIGTLPVESLGRAGVSKDEVAAVCHDLAPSASAEVLSIGECLRHPLLRCIDSGHSGFALVDAAARTLRITGSIPDRLMGILIVQACKYMCVPWKAVLGWLAGRCVDISLPLLALRVQEKCGFVPDWVRPAPHPLELGDPCGVASARHPDPYGDFVGRLVPRLGALAGPYRCSMHPDIPT